MPCSYFREHFIKDYMLLAHDKVAAVRREFVSAMLTIKPFFDNDSDLNMNMLDLLTQMAEDTNKEVREAVEYTDFELLQNRKKHKDNKVDEESKIEFQAQLKKRGKEEDEERKKRSEDDEENKYDAYLSDKKWKARNAKFSYNKRAVGLKPSTTGTKKPAEPGNPKTPLKKKNAQTTKPSDMDSSSKAKTKIKEDGKTGKPIRRNTISSTLGPNGFYL